MIKAYMFPKALSSLIIVSTSPQLSTFLIAVIRNHINIFQCLKFYIKEIKYSCVIFGG